MNKYNKVIAILELSAGNESVGINWYETKSFPKNTPVEKIIEWSESYNTPKGHLIITIDKNTEDIFNNEKEIKRTSI